MPYFTSSTSKVNNLYKEARSTLSIKSIILHVLCWSAYIGYELSFLGYYLGGKFEAPIVYISYYTINIILFYGQVGVFNLTFEHRRLTKLQGLLLFFALLIAVFIIKFWVSYALLNPRPSLAIYAKNIPGHIKTTFFRLGIFILLATFYWAASHISYFRKQVHEAEKKHLLALKEKLEVEARLAESHNAFLTQQLNPHLLFNSLNFIYNSVYQQSAEGAACVLLLSDIMRFSLNETGEDGKVSVIDEIAQVKNLIQINRYRFNQVLSLEVNIDIASGQHRIIPLILLTLTENLFKHGNLKNAREPALLDISVSEAGKLVYHVRNLKKSKSDYAKRSQLGLQHTRIRLDFAYRGKYELNITESDDIYELWLNLQL